MNDMDKEIEVVGDFLAEHLGEKGIAFLLIAANEDGDLIRHHCISNVEREGVRVMVEKQLEVMKGNMDEVVSTSETPT